MKKVSLFSVFFAAVLFSSCSEKSINNDFVDMDDVISISKVVSADVQTKAGELIKTDVVFTADYSISQDKVLSFELDTDDESIDINELNAALTNALADEMGVEFTDLSQVESAIAGSSEEDNLVKCLQECKETEEKGNGLGKCRFKCWYSAAVRVIKFILPIVVPLLK